VTGGSAGKGGTSTGGKSTGGSSTGGTSGSAGTGPTGGTAGSGGTGTSGNAGVGGEPTDGGMGGVGADGGMGGEGGEMTVFDVLDNPGFEMGDVGTLNVIPGWQESGDLDASYVEWTGGRNGSHKLGHWRMWVMTTAETYTASTHQTVEPIANGTYTFSMYVMRDQWFTEQYLFARDHNASVPTEVLKVNTADTMSNSAYIQVTLSNIQVTTGKCTVGIYSAAPGGVWANIDDASFTKDP